MRVLIFAAVAAFGAALVIGAVAWLRLQDRRAQAEVRLFTSRPRRQGMP